MTYTFYAQYGKRWFDFIVALSGLIFAFPIFILVAIAICIDSPGSPFFRQSRVGQSGKLFRIIKFRTMRASTSAKAPLLTASGDPRITRVGRWLRKTKIDEFPQLFNALWGDMSLVGPRPEVSKYTSLYNAEHQQVLEAKPGITGPAAIASVDEEAVLARQANPEEYYVNFLMPAKLDIDLSYCRDIRLSTDLKLIFQTFGRVFVKRKHRVATMENTSKQIQEVN